MSSESEDERSVSQAVEGILFSGKTVNAFLKAIAATLGRVPIDNGQNVGRLDLLRQLKTAEQHQLSVSEELTRSEVVQFLLLEVALDLAVHEVVLDKS